MAKLTRKIAKLFGQDAGAIEIAQFGSLAASSPAYTTDPDTIQALSQWLDGWFAAVIGSNSPAIEDMNALCYVYAYQIAYFMQTGIPEYLATTTYYIGSIANDGIGKLYISRTDDNIGNALTDGDNWTPLPASLTTDIYPGTDVVIPSGETMTYFNLNIEAAKEWTVTGSLVTGNLTVAGTLNVPGTLVTLY